jgi:hypothetical protein
MKADTERLADLALRQPAHPPCRQQRRWRFNLKDEKA